MSFSVNGRDQGVAFRVSKSELGGHALFPHVLTKNQNFSVNFGQMPAPMASLTPGFMPIGQLDVGDGLVRGSRPPPSKADCEVTSRKLRYENKSTALSFIIGSSNDRPSRCGQDSLGDRIQSSVPREEVQHLGHEHVARPHEGERASAQEELPRPLGRAHRHVHAMLR